MIVSFYKFVESPADKRTKIEVIDVAKTVMPEIMTEIVNIVLIQKQGQYRHSRRLTWFLRKIERGHQTFYSRIKTFA